MRIIRIGLSRNEQMYGHSFIMSYEGAIQSNSEKSRKSTSVHQGLAGTKTKNGLSGDIDYFLLLNYFLSGNKLLTFAKAYFSI